MSLKTASVKVEPESDFSENECGVSEAALREGLYADHEIEGDLVLGPVQLQSPDIASTVQTIKEKPDAKKAKQAQKELRSCSMCRRQGQHYTCNHCEVQFFRKIGIIQHLRRDYCKLVCKICEKEFKYHHVLTKHMVVHSSKRPFSCSVCKKKFKTEDAVVSHMLIHSKEKPHKCGYCEKSFKMKGSLQVHERTHTGEKPFQCSLCSKGFVQQTSLNNHELTHKGIKPYLCDICYKRFRQSSNLRQHTARYHSGEPSAPSLKEAPRKGNRVKQNREGEVKSLRLIFKIRDRVKLS